MGVLSENPRVEPYEGQKRIYNEMNVEQPTTSVLMGPAIPADRRPPKRPSYNDGVPQLGESRGHREVDMLQRAMATIATEVLPTTSAGDFWSSPMSA
ncbi:unnamed protein product [Gordionus sp. m RMFG-2023]